MWDQIGDNDDDNYSYKDDNIGNYTTNNDVDIILMMI